MDFMLGTVAKIDRVDLAKQAEDLGYSHFGVAEGPLLFSDPYAYLALAARETSRIKLGTWVTNPLTRIPPQTANHIATLNAIAPGRTFLGFGAANNAMRSMGMRPARIAETEDAIRVITGMLRGERVDYEWDGRRRPIEFLDPEGGWYNIADPIPVYLAAGGPRSLELAGRVADAVVYSGGGRDVRFIRLIRRLIDEAAARAGRPRGSVKLVAATFFYLLRDGEGLTEAVEQGFGSGPLVSALLGKDLARAHAGELGEALVSEVETAAGAYLGSGGPVGEDAHLQAWKTYMRGFDRRHTSLISRGIVDAFCIWGTADECLEQAHAMAEAGVDAIEPFLSNPARYDRDTRDFAEAIIQRW